MEAVTHERNSLDQNKQQNNFIKCHNAMVSYK